MATLHPRFRTHHAQTPFLLLGEQGFRAYARCLCLSWHDPALLRRLLTRIAHSLAIAGRIGSSGHHHSAAYYAQST